MPLSPVDIRVWEWIEYHLSHLFWPLVKLVAFCSSTRMSPPRHPSTFRKFKLLCNECSFMRTWWSFFCSLPYEQNRTGRSLELRQNITTNISTRPFWKFRTVVNVVTRDTELSPSICHHNFTQSGAHLSSTAPMAVSVWSGSQQCALAGRPLVPT